MPATIIQKDTRHSFVSLVSAIADGSECSGTYFTDAGDELYIDDVYMEFKGSAENMERLTFFKRKKVELTMETEFQSLLHIYEYQHEVGEEVELYEDSSIQRVFNISSPATESLAVYLMESPTQLHLLWDNNNGLIDSGEIQIY